MEGIIITILILVFSAILHEIAHGYVADKLGDPTARLMGRLTLNPIPHIDPIMSILLPIMLIVLQFPMIFAAAKPVPVNPLMLREGRKDLALVALAGPLTNLALALTAAGLIRLIGANPILEAIIVINLSLGFLNLIPIPPLDGSKFFSIFFPVKALRTYYSFAPYGIFLLFALLSLTPLGEWLHLLILNTSNVLGVK